ncbi:hypothetical protein PLESTB_000824500 [Pleodorina starrii]|uniref:Uncharacterized protein n=1 Tax=Pleodorina starrii TaxID=330485 RepID=A0A9W6BLB0_9CHLO|nr:hypothetical protein PLESTM_000139900 [Pleodorina starrii]GLC54108.1 hypothetical protein PLESTB_000824500 [Pleodorina starrii]GLC64589.1 hypothetical protein PLESTF_000182100 [Pleodorina starrii]
MSFREQDPRAHFVGREITLYGAQPEFQGNTSYQSDFTAHPVPPRQAAPVGQQYTGNPVPFDGTSAYKQDYQAHPIEPRPPASGVQWQPNPAPFDGTSAYRENYRGHAIDPSQLNRTTGPARPYNPNPAPFDGNTSYRQDFTQHPVERRQPTAAGAYQPNPAPFDGTSHYKADYTAHPIEPRQPAPPAAMAANTAPFEGQTHYRDDFKPHTLEPRPPPPAAQYQPNPAPFQGSSETRDQFQAWPVDPTTGQRQAPLPPMRPSAAFEGSSTYSQDYRGWKMPARRPALGVQMKGDRTYVLIPADAQLPAAGKQIFTTVHDNQTEICVLVLRGDAQVASRNNVIGQFDLKGIPPAPRGTARIEVCLHLDASNVLSATATDLDANRHEQWLRQGSMEARTHATDVMTL